MRSDDTYDRDWKRLSVPLGAVVPLIAATLLGMADVAGFGASRHRLEHADSWWLLPSAAAVLAAFCAYYFAYRGIHPHHRWGGA